MHILRAVLLWAFLIHARSSPAFNHRWEEWKTKYQKVYGNQAEVLYRRAVWEENRNLVLKHNREASAGLHTFTMGLNHLADMTAEEVNDRLNGLKVEDPNSFISNWTFSQARGLTIPPSVDWRLRDMVSPVQNQGLCGSCWAFGAVGALEGQMKKRTGVLITLSPQNLLDCSAKDGNHGCKGGYLSKAYNYIIRNKGIDSECFYPYKHKVGKCRYSVKQKAGYCSDFRILPRGDEKALQAAVGTVGPVAVAINAMLPSFHQYRGGVYNAPGCNPSFVNHAVLVVGYGTEKGKDFWIVKNSWGTAWGEGGFFRLARNKNNLCGIANFAIYPVV